MKIFEDLEAFIWRVPEVNNCNTYLISGITSLLIDPGHLQFFPQVNSELISIGMSTDDIRLVICTHGHPDHIEAVHLFKEKRDHTVVGIHKKEELLIKRLREQYQGMMGLDSPDIKFDILFKEGELRVGKHEFLVLHTPGHSPGSICLYWPERKALFTGDLIFYQGVGRTDLPGGDPVKLKESIQKVRALDLELILPGHGELVVGKEEVLKNFQFIEKVFFEYL